MLDPQDTTILSSPDSATGERQQALARILAALLTTPAQGRPFAMSSGEVRAAIRMAGNLVGDQEVLNYEHPLLPDPVVSCASKQQLLDNLVRRFSYQTIQQ